MAEPRFVTASLVFRVFVSDTNSGLNCGLDVLDRSVIYAALTASSLQIQANAHLLSIFIIAIQH
jgi:hypothetical protein